MGFSVTIMALLARLRVLVQQVFRDFYPVSDDFVTLECVWKSDKFILLERKHKRVNESQAVDSGGIVFVQTSNVNYNCIVSFLGDDRLVPKRVADVAAKKDPCHINDKSTDLLIGSSPNDDKETIYNDEGENQGITKASINKSLPEVGLHALSPSTTNDKLHSCRRRWHLSQSRILH
uniref:Uncharacterized protein n=1 Tax=Glycine max TaxID=3847 RepID=A0A0R0J418_SOYBN